MAAPLDIHDFKDFARRAVPRMFFGHAGSGERTETTYRANFMHRDGAAGRPFGSTT